MWPDDRVSFVLRCTKVCSSLINSAGAVINRLAPPPESSIAIYGLGAVGMAGILAAAHLQVRTIIAIDVVPSRLATAKEFGATHTLDARAPDIVAQVRALTLHGAGSEYTLEASGNMRAFRTAYEATAPGGHMTSAGTPGPGVKPDFDIFEHVCTAKIYSAVLMGCCYPREVSWVCGRQGTANRSFAIVVCPILDRPPSARQVPD